MESDESDFLERQKKERTRIIISFDNQIVEAHGLLDKVNSQIKKLSQQDKSIPRHLFSFKLVVMKYISDLVERRGHFVMHLTMDSALEKKISEMMPKHDEAGQDS